VPTKGEGDHRSRLSVEVGAYDLRTPAGEGNAARTTDRPGRAGDERCFSLEEGFHA
jgi:hypothetical protein